MSVGASMQAGTLYATSGSKWHRFVKTRVKSLPLGKPKPKIAFNPFNSRPSHVSGGIEYLPCSAFRDSTYLGWPSNVVIHACPPTRIESRRPPTTTTIPSHDRPQTYRTPHPTDTSSRTPRRAPGPPRFPTPPLRDRDAVWRLRACSAVVFPSRKAVWVEGQGEEATEGLISVEEHVGAERRGHGIE